MSTCPASAQQLPHDDALPATAEEEAGGFIFGGDPSWLMIDDEFTPIREHEFESLFSVSNGYLASRASLPFGAALSAPTVFIAGVFDFTPPSSMPELVAVPGWTLLSQSTGATRFATENLVVMEHRRLLDMQQGMFRREFCFAGKDGHVMHVRFLRLASLADRHLLLQSSLCMSQTYSGPVTLQSGFLPARNAPAKSFAPSATLLDTRHGPIRLFEWQTRTGTSIALAIATRFSAAGHEMHDPHAGRTMDAMEDIMQVEVEAGKQYRIDWLEVCYTSRDVDRPAQAAAAHLEKLLANRTQVTVQRHVEAWGAHWQSADIVIDGDADAQKAIRFACYHLISAANPEDERVSIGARALTGPAYKGHVFWDTEIFLLPFYTFTDPPAARALLMYRFHTLAAARNKACAQGYRGALYAWESADTGDDVTPAFALTPLGEIEPVLTGQQAHHISADVAYAAWQYWQATGDDAFLRDAGAEILVETARFWASRCTLEGDGRFHIRAVVGPDEYHDSIDDNAYTNWMAQWNLECAAAASRLLQQRWPQQWQALAARIRLDDTEPVHWLDVSARMHTGAHTERSPIEQFDGYFALEDVNLARFSPRSLPIDVILGRNRTRGTQLVKQADVVMLLHLLAARIPAAVQQASFRYYEPRTEHGSSLSPAIHALLAARLGDTDMALRYFQQAREIDLANNMGNAAGGVHIAALGGLWQAVIFGFAGLSLNERGLSFAPHCPSGWRSLCFSLQWHGQRIRVRITPTMLQVGSVSTPVSPPVSVPVTVDDAPPALLRAGCTLRWELTDGRWKEIAHECR